MMKKILLITLCLFTLYACEQESINPTTYEVSEKKGSSGSGTFGPAYCDLTQIPLYIPPASNVLSGTIDFANAFPVTESDDYETFNGVNLNVTGISYSVDGAPLIGSQFNYVNNVTYQLTIDVVYSNGTIVHTETFDLVFNVSGTQSLGWGGTEFCLHNTGKGNKNKNAKHLKTVQALIIPD